MNITTKVYFTFNAHNSALIIGQNETGISALVDTILKRFEGALNPELMKYVIYRSNSSNSKISITEEKIKQKHLYSEIQFDNDEGLNNLEHLAEESIKRSKSDAVNTLLIIYIEDWSIEEPHLKRFQTAVITLNEHAIRANIKLIFATSHISSDYMPPELRDSFDLILSGQLESVNDEEYFGLTDTTHLRPDEFFVKELRSVNEISNVFQNNTELDWTPPSASLLQHSDTKASAGDVAANAKVIYETLNGHGIDVKVLEANVGPSFTQFLLEVSNESTLSEVLKFEGNVALDLRAHAIRCEILNNELRLIGIEVPHVVSATVNLGAILAKQYPAKLEDQFEIPIGKDVSGEVISVNLAKINNIMVGGQTGSGKTTILNVIITSLIIKNSPQSLRLILIDPKQVEFLMYAGLPHLLAPVLTAPEDWIVTLQNVVIEVNRRVALFEFKGLADIASYNKQNEVKLPRIVILTDEFSDMMMANGAEVERMVIEISRVAARAGVNLIISTSRPSVDVYTSVIRSAFTTRFGFVCASIIDSQVLIDEPGLEKLQGRGDMLFRFDSNSKTIRIQAPLISYEESMALVCDKKT